MPFPGPNKGIARLYGNARSRRPYKNKSVDDLAGQTRGLLTAIRHTGYCLKECSATWLFSCSQCGGESEITRKQFQRTHTPYPCPLCQKAPQKVENMEVTPNQKRQIARLTADERKLYDIVMRGRAETRTNVAEALAEVTLGKENVMAFYAPRKFHAQPVAAGSSLSPRQFGYKQKRAA